MAIMRESAWTDIADPCEVIDLLLRLDGIDFRQTCPPLKAGTPFLRRYGAEWRASEQTLTRPLGSIRPTMIARAGGTGSGQHPTQPA